MKYKVVFSFVIFFFIMISNVFAQSPEMADVMRSNGKIYVVVAVVALILAGVLFYLINIDKKITKLEKELKDE